MGQKQSYASTAATMGGNMYDQGVSMLTELGNKYPDNESVSAFITGAYQDAGNTMMQGGLALQYNTAMNAQLAEINQGLENLKTGNQLKLMGAEGRIAENLIGAQGKQQRLGLKTAGKEQRKNIVATGEQDRLSIAATGVEQRAGIREQGDQDRMSIAATGTEQRKGMRVKGSEDRKTVRTQGAEERLTIGKRFQEERNMRSDARGAIRSLGARFFG